MFPLGWGQIVNILSRLESRAIQANPHQCSRVRHRRSTCTRCADACPTHAIAFTDSMQVESAKCTDCGICATVCPTGALESKSPTNAELLEKIKPQIEASPSIVFTCSKYLETTRIPSVAVIQVKCLGRLDESLLFGTIALGAQSVSLLDGVCADCPQSIGRRIVGQTVQMTNALLTAFGVSRPVVFDERRLSPTEASPDAAPAEGFSRRGFFDYLLRETVKASAVTANAVLAPDDSTSETPLPKGQLPKRVPAKLNALLKAMRKIGTPATSQWSGGIWAHFGFTGKCNGCQACAFFCPTGALSKIEQEDPVGVAFKTSLCTDCRLCREICYQDAVTLSPTIDLNQVVNESVDTFLMANKASVPWNIPAEERIRDILKSSLETEQDPPSALAQGETPAMLLDGRGEDS